MGTSQERGVGRMGGHKKGKWGAQLNPEGERE